MANAAEYHAGESFYYRAGGRVLQVDEIMPADFGNAGRADSIFLNKPTTNADALRKERTAAQAHLDQDIARYVEICAHGAAALSRYDVEIASGGDAEGALALALSLKHNHIAYGKAKLLFLDALLCGAGQQGELF